MPYSDDYACLRWGQLQEQTSIVLQNNGRALVVKKHMRRQEPPHISPVSRTPLIVEIRAVPAQYAQNVGEADYRISIWLKLLDRMSVVRMWLGHVHAEQQTGLAILGSMPPNLICLWSFARQLHTLCSGHLQHLSD